MEVCGMQVSPVGVLVEAWNDNPTTEENRIQIYLGINISVQSRHCYSGFVLQMFIDKYVVFKHELRCVATLICL